jgi:YbbR domain-containing protein
MKRLNKFASSKTFTIIISLVIAILLWVYVVNYENNNIPATITGIPISYIGEDDILEDRQLLVSDKIEQTVSVKVLGKRSIVSSLTKDSFIITADLTNVTQSGENNIAYTVDFVKNLNTEGVYILEKSPQILRVIIDNMTKKTVEVREDFQGSTAEGYMKEPVTFNPATVTVSGPEEVISKIEYASVLIKRENLSKSVSGTVSYDLRDADDNIISVERLSLEPELVSFYVPVVKTKDVVLSVELIEGGGAKKKDAVIEITPQVITLSGDAATLDGINQIYLGTIDLSSFISSTNQVFSIPLPNDVTNISGETEASVTVTVKGLETKRLYTTNIELINAAEGCRAIPITQSKEVVIRGPAEIIDLIEPQNIRIVADLSSLGNSKGRYSVDTRVTIDGYSEAGVVGSDYAIVVELQED